MRSDRRDIVKLAGIGLAASFGPRTARAAASKQIEERPANPRASARVRATLAYLHDLRRRRRTLIGQFLGYPNVNLIPGNSFSIDPAREVFERTGKWPALVGGDYSGRTSANESNIRRLNYEAVNPVLKAYAAQGGLITFCNHWINPFPPHGLRDRGADLALLLQPGPTGTLWMQQIDYVADGLADLQRSGVVVLFRPLHEFTSTGGESHWWTLAKATGTVDFFGTMRRLWIDMFAYLTETRGLHNLLWVWNPKRNGMAGYPGAAYVDVVGPDVYDGAYSERYEENFQGDLRGLLNTGKVFAVQETGPEEATRYDARRIARVLEVMAPETAYVLVWHDPNFRLSRMQNLPELLADPRFITRDEMPRELRIAPTVTF